MKIFRNNGVVGALLDEYEKSLNELNKVIEDVSDDDLIKIVDPITKDEDCRSIQSILTDVVQSGYTYVVEIRKWLGEEIAYKDKAFLSSAEAYETAIIEMFRYNEKLFDDYPDMETCVLDNDRKINVRWGQQYDPEQLMQHAIVHVLKHRRQIEKFNLKLNNKMS